MQMLMSKEYETYLGFIGDECLNAEVEERNLHCFFYSRYAPFDTNGLLLMISMGNEQAPMKIVGSVRCKQPCYEYFRHDCS